MAKGGKAFPVQVAWYGFSNQFQQCRHKVDVAQQPIVLDTPPDAACRPADDECDADARIVARPLGARYLDPMVYGKYKVLDVWYPEY